MAAVKENKTMMRAIDLFAGIGGFRLALERAGHECVFASEIDEATCDAYQENFGDRPVGDITQVATEDIPDHDILTAGFPCQAFSTPGYMRGFSDPRGMLFYEIIRIAARYKPNLMVLENVYGILGIDGGAVLRQIMAELKAIGYYVQLLVLNAAHYGFIQARKRVYFVCTRKKILPIRIWPRRAGRVVADIVEDDVDAKWDVNLDSKLSITWERNPLRDRERRQVRIGYFGKGTQCDKIYDVLGYAATALTGYSGFYLIDGRVRRFTDIELRRIMGFPDDHVISGGAAGRKQLGNAVIPGMIELVLDAAGYRVV